MKDPSVFMEYILPILVAFFTGAAGSLFAPWAKWGVEKRKQKLINRKQTIEKWRDEVKSLDFLQSDIENTIFYSSIRPHLKEEVIDKIEDIRTIYLGGRSGTKTQLLDEIARIEKDWGLI